MGYLLGLGSSPILRAACLRWHPSSGGNGAAPWWLPLVQRQFLKKQLKKKQDHQTSSNIIKPSKISINLHKSHPKAIRVSLSLVEKSGWSNFWDLPGGGRGVPHGTSRNRSSACWEKEVLFWPLAPKKWWGYHKDMMITCDYPSSNQAWIAGTSPIYII